MKSNSSSPSDQAWYTWSQEARSMGHFAEFARELSGRTSAAIMVIYNHNPDRDSLEAAIRCVDKLVLVDNHSDPGIVTSLRGFVESHPDSCLLIENNENLGLSRAYNLAIARLREMGVYWLYLLDHDAVFDDSLFLETRAAWDECTKVGIDVGIVVPIVSDDPKALGRNLGFRRKYSTIRTAITSGIMTNLDVFSALHGFDERYFTDGADVDFTLRVVTTGRALVRFNKVLMFQSFGSKPLQRDTLVAFLDKVTATRSIIFLKLGFGNVHQTGYHVYPPDRRRAQVATSQLVDHSHSRSFLGLYHLISQVMISSLSRIVR